MFGLKRLSCLILFVLLGAPLKAKNIIFDLHGVLIEHSDWSMADHLGKMNCLFYSGDLGYRFNEFLGLLEPHDNIKMEVFSKKTGKIELKPFPKSFVEWQRGNVTSKTVVELAHKEIEKNPNFFQSSLEKELIHGIARAMLPENLVVVVSPIKDMVKLVQDCNGQLDSKGNKKHKLFILSNWDKESFPLVYENSKFKKIFDCFDKDKVIISSEIKLVKPEPEIYKYVIDKFKLDPKECIFIDDQEQNVDAAKKAGIKAICHKNCDETRQFLRECGVFKVKKAKNKTKPKAEAAPVAVPAKVAEDSKGPVKTPEKVAA